MLEILKLKLTICHNLPIEITEFTERSIGRFAHMRLSATSKTVAKIKSEREGFWRSADRLR
jgi:hypothetical protein